MSKYAEVRNDYYDDIEGVHCIDAWLTDDDNEEGQVIAKIHADKTVEYIDPDAKFDTYAQEVISEVIR